MNGDDAETRPTNLVDLMNELVPPPEPEPISLVPQTIGWPLLGVLLICLVVGLWLYLRQRRRAEAYRKTALNALEAAGQDAGAVARVLRQTALTAFPRRDVAGLFGDDWLGFLDATCAGADFRTGPGSALASSPYRDDAILSDAALSAVRQWITHHNRAATL